MTNKAHYAAQRRAFKNPRERSLRRGGLHSHHLNKLLGVSKLPPEGMAAQEIEGIKVYVKPLSALKVKQSQSLYGGRTRAQGHRVMVVCPDCGKHFSAGKFFQHYETKHLGMPTYGQRWKMRSNPSRGSVDSTAAHELALYAVNNAQLYRQQIEPIIKNLRRKIAKGVYQPELALKLWRYAADTAAKMYTYEFDVSGRVSAGKPASHHGVAGYGIFNVPTRVEAAREMMAHYAEEVQEPHTNPRRRVRRNAIQKKPVHRRIYRAFIKVAGSWQSIGKPQHSEAAVRALAKSLRHIRSPIKLTVERLR